MNLRDFDYVIAVATYGNFSQAAAACHVSQPTLSMQIKKLEAYIGIPLFERGHRQVSLTREGKTLLAHARQILQARDDFLTCVTNFKNPLSGPFSLGAFPTLAPYYLPQAVPAIVTHLPGVKLSLVEEKTETLIHRLQTGQLDAALLALPVTAPGLNSQPLFDDPFLLAVPAGHPLAKAKTVKLEALTHSPLLLMEDGHCLGDQALAVCAMAGADTSETYRATSLETLRQMVVAGRGITLIPALAQTRDPSLRYIPFADPAPKRTIGLVWRKGYAKTALLDKISGCLPQGGP